MGVFHIDVNMVKQMVMHEIGVALIVVGSQANILIQIDTADGGEIQLPRLVTLHQILVCPLGAAAGSQAQNTIWLGLDQISNNRSGFAAHFLVIHGSNNSHESTLFSKDTCILLHVKRIVKLFL